MKSIIKYLENDLKESINNDVKKVVEYHSSPQRTDESGFFSIPRQVFCYVDYLGYIAFGRNGKTKNAEDFLKEYFPKRYKEYAELIFAMWRQGTVHYYKPVAFYVEYPNNSPKKITIKWLSNNDSTQGHRSAHLNFYKMERKKGCLCFVVNICQLVDDLLMSIDTFIEKLKKNTTLKNECNIRFKENNKVQPHTFFMGNNRQQVIKNQVLDAWSNVSGVINSNGEPA